MLHPSGQCKGRFGEPDWFKTVNFLLSLQTDKFSEQNFEIVEMLCTFGCLVLQLLNKSSYQHVP